MTCNADVKTKTNLLEAEMSGESASRVVAGPVWRDPEITDENDNSMNSPEPKVEAIFREILFPEMSAWSRQFRRAYLLLLPVSVPLHIVLWLALIAALAVAATPLIVGGSIWSALCLIDLGTRTFGNWWLSAWRRP